MAPLCANFFDFDIKTTFFKFKSSACGSHNGKDPESQLPPVKSHPKPRAYYLSVCSICLCVFIATVNTINFASALPAVASSLSATTSEAYWCGIALLFAQCIAQVIYGTFAEIFGRKSCLLFALFIFGSGSLLAALAHNIDSLIAWRAMQGIGAGGINVCVNLIVVDLAPRRDRPRLNGIVSLSGAFGLLAGVLSGSEAAEYSWRIMFYINIVVAVLAFVLVMIFLNLPTVQDKAVVARLKSADWTGIAILSGSIAGVIYAVVSGGSVYPWSSARILTPLTIGGIGFVAFGLFEEYLAGRYGLGKPFMPLRLFASRTAVSGYLITLLHGVVLWAIPYYFLYYIHISASRSFMESGVLCLPAVLLTAPSAAVAGIYMSRLSHFKYFNVAAFILMAAGCAGLSTLRANPTTGQILGFQFLFSIGGGILFPGRLAAVQASQKQLDESDEVEVRMATSLVSFTTSLGQAFGIAMGSTAMQGAWDSLVKNAIATGLLDEHDTILGTEASRATTLIADFSPAVRELYRDIAARSVALVWYICISLSILGVLAALASRNLDMDNPKTSQRKH